MQIDWSRVDDLRRDIGDDLAEVVALFLEECDEVIPRLQTGDDLADDLHFLKGAALNLGFAALAVMCQSAEQAARTGGVPDLPALIALYRQSRAAFVAGLA